NKSYSYIDNNGVSQTVTYNPHSEGAFAYSPASKQGTFSFDISNNLEMKIKSDRDTTGYRKISLIDELGASITYNTVAPEKQWGNLNMRLRLKLTKSYTFSTNAIFATYAYTYDKTTGQVVEGNRTEWSYGRFGRFQGMNQGFSYTFSNDTWKKWFGPKDREGDSIPVEDEPMPESGLTHTEDNGEEIPTKRTTKRAEVGADGYQEFKMPWSFSISYSANLREDRTKPIKEKSMRYPFSISHSLNGSGNIKLSNKWAVNFNTGWDFQAHAITQTTFSISRDLHCFNMSASLSPFGYYQSYSFCIRANSSMLSDLKWDKRGNAYSSNIQWY
ncbi:MAG: LPS-assembly protein LptD, partial [Bacteroides sp.]|nr:LPS-assembly protein LptD [Bacteroides sp.]